MRVTDAIGPDFLDIQNVMLGDQPLHGLSRPPPIFGQTCRKDRSASFLGRARKRLRVPVGQSLHTAARKRTRPPPTGLLTKIQDRIDTQQNDFGFMCAPWGMPPRGDRCGPWAVPCRAALRPVPPCFRSDTPDCTGHGSMSAR